MSSALIKTLIDSSGAVENELSHYGWELNSENFSGLPPLPWSIRLRRLHGGKQEGVEVIELDNGTMALTIVPTRGMNVLDAHCHGIRLGWNSPVKEVVHPRWIQPESRGGTGWLEGFNEMMCRCGLESTGAPSVDPPNGGEGSGIFLPLHGRISNTPASRVWISCQTEPPYHLKVGGNVRETRMFGPSYLLTTEISTVPGTAEFKIEDEITTADSSAELESLYHCNFGPPLLGEGSRLIAPVKKMSARDHRALEGLSNWDSFGPPQSGFEEQCYFCTLHGNDAGRTSVALVNADGNHAVRLEYPLEQLPAFTLWKNTSAESEGYVAGLEPGTDYPNPRAFERKKGRVVSLKRGESYRTELNIGLTTGIREVKSLIEEIEAIADKRAEISPTIDGELSPVQE